MPRTLVFPLTVTPTGQLHTVEQGTGADIESCVTAILKTPRGWRTDDPRFGRPPRLVFRQGGADPQQIADQIARDEPRATGDIVAQAIDNHFAQLVQTDPTGGR